MLVAVGVACGKAACLWAAGCSDVYCYAVCGWAIGGQAFGGYVVDLPAAVGSVVCWSAAGPYLCGCAAIFFLYLFIIHLNRTRPSFIGVSIVFCVYKNPFEEKNNVILCSSEENSTSQLFNYSQ